MQLVYEGTNQPVMIGDVVKTFRDELVVVQSITPPHKPSSTGRVFVKPISEDIVNAFGSVLYDPPCAGREYFPSVIGAVWVERTDQGTYTEHVDEEGNQYIVYADGSKTSLW
jgi:hypothetical protein